MNKKIVVHGHRGSRGTHPENTLPAFQEAVDAGAQFLELDLHLTADDVLVVVHDPELTAKLCKGPNGKTLKKAVSVRKIKLKELKKYDCGSVAQDKFPEQKRVPGTRIPTLEEVLAWRAKVAPTIELNIETKMDGQNVPTPEIFVTKVIELLRKYQAIEATILQSFEFKTLEAAKKMEPKLRLSALFDEKEKDICNRAAQLGVQVVSPHFSLATMEEIKACHAKSLQVVPWTLNEESQWTAAIAAGVDGIITDYPRKLMRFLNPPPPVVAPTPVPTTKP